MDDAETSSEPPGRSTSGPAGLELGVHDDTGSLTPADVACLREGVERALDHLGCAGDLRVRIVGDDAMADANERWAGHAGTTDVLTFDLGTSGRALDADLLLCADEAKRQADLRGHEAWRELLLYVVHGVLHCLGHDDHDEAGAGEMHRIEDETLAAIGVGRTYAAGAGHGDMTP